MCCSSARTQRYIIERCLKWINQRKAFGKPLANQAVVRAKVAAMISRAEAIQAWLENITYQMSNMVLISSDCNARESMLKCTFYSHISNRLAN